MTSEPAAAGGGGGAAAAVGHSQFAVRSHPTVARRPLALRLVVLHGRNFLGTLFGISQGTFLQNKARLKRDAQSQVA